MTDIHLKTKMENSVIEKTFPHWSYIIVGIFQSCSSVIGIFINGIIIHIFQRYKRFHTSTYIYMMFLNVGSIFIAVLANPIEALTSFMYKWIYGYVGCQIYGFVACFISYTQIWLTVIIAVDRYVALTNSKSKFCKFYRQKANPYAIVLGCAIHSFIWALVPILGWGSYQLEGMMVSCSINWKSKALSDFILDLSLSVDMWIIPFIIISHCYARIYLQLRDSGRSLKKWKARERNTTAKRSRIARRNTTAKRHRIALKSSIFTIATYAITWTPYAVVSAWIAIAHPDTMPEALTIVPALFVKVYNLYGPFICLYNNKMFKATLVKHFSFFAFCTKKNRANSQQRQRKYHQHSTGQREQAIG